MVSPFQSRRQAISGIVGVAGALIGTRSWGDEKQAPAPISEWVCEQVWSCYDRRSGNEIERCPTNPSGLCEELITGKGPTEEAAIANLNINAATRMGPKCAANGGAIAKAKGPRNCTAPDLVGKLDKVGMVCCSGFHAVSSFRISLPNCTSYDLGFDGYGTRRIAALRDARAAAEIFAASICGRICCKLASVVKPCCERPVVRSCSSCG
jgi:hypothetical protein